MSIRRRIPAVRNMSHQLCFACSSSSLMVRSIWAISARTITEFRSPSAWYLARMSKASSCRSLLIKYRGLSGRKKTNTTWIIAGASCSSDGILHAQLLAIVTVPKPTEAATIWPM
ncbi:hypothetical protein BDV27DRAFT_136066, partial [Aspergillus caelatus]